ncbi:MAG: transcription termination factor NusA [Desulfobacteraceae bacterium]
MLITDIKRVIEQVGREKGINTAVLIGALKEAVESAAKKKLGPSADIEVHYDEKTGEVEVFQFKEVVESVEDPVLELTLKEGLKYDTECEIGDSLGIKVDTSMFGRIAAQSAKQVIIQRMKAAERNAVYENFIHKKGEIINGIVQRIDRGNIIVNLGQAEAVLSAREQVAREHYKRGDRIRAYILDVLEESRGAQVILSRVHPEFVARLFTSEVPEISEGIVSIKGAAREAGVRCKIAVSSSDADVDPVGACVGMKGNRVQNIVQELRGEKIDIVPWSPDVAKFVCNALAPAEITRVIIDEDNKTMEVIVSDEFLSIAIGKNGQNVRLACKLTGWHLDVMSEKEYARQLKQGYEDLMIIPGMTLVTAEALYSSGFYSPEDILDASIEDLITAEGISESLAEQLIENAKQISRGHIDEYPETPDTTSFESAEENLPESDDRELSDSEENLPESDDKDLPDSADKTIMDREDMDHMEDNLSTSSENLIDASSTDLDSREPSADEEISQNRDSLENGSDFREPEADTPGENSE